MNDGERKKRHKHDDRRKNGTDSLASFVSNDTEVVLKSGTIVYASFYNQKFTIVTTEVEIRVDEILEVTEKNISKLDSMFQYVQMKIHHPDTDNMTTNHSLLLRHLTIDRPFWSIYENLRRDISGVIGKKIFYDLSERTSYLCTLSSPDISDFGMVSFEERNDEDLPSWVFSDRIEWKDNIPGNSEAYGRFTIFMNPVLGFQVEQGRREHDVFPPTHWLLHVLEALILSLGITSPIQSLQLPAVILRFVSGYEDMSEFEMIETFLSEFLSAYDVTLNIRTHLYRETTVL